MKETTTERRITEPEVPSLAVRVNVMAYVAMPGYLKYHEKKRAEAAEARGEPVAT